jgi:spermidine synthase
VTSIVVLPASFVAGYQFPLLINLLGRGRGHVGREVGLGYAWNTLGAIAGALAGGFGVMQLLGAPGTWRLVVLLLTALAVLAIVLSAAGERSARRLVLPGLAVPVTLLLIASTGPTAAWRHTPIGAGRARLSDLSSNGIRKWMNEARRGILWEAEGRESSVALQGLMGLSFLINGRSDGSARYDAATQVMCGIVGAILHPRPTKALVVGLGTGSTAGWLADVPTMERVDVAELEPAILRVADACEPVNRDVMRNPKVHIWLGDAREILLTTRERYDLIVSEPSNPFRSGIASLFTREYYRAVTNRMTAGGIFLQWLQAYEVDGKTIRTILATLASVFPCVEIWQTETVDLLIACSMRPPVYDVPALRARIAEEPFRSALAKVWRVNSLEGFFSRFVAGPALAAGIAREEGSAVNTDDLPLVEFGFARTVGRGGLFRIDELYEAAREAGVHRPERLDGRLDWDLVEDERIALFTVAQEPARLVSQTDQGQILRARAQAHYLEGDFTNAIASWQAQERGPQGLVETVVVADLLATAGAQEAVPFIEHFRSVDPSEADVLSAILARNEGRLDDAADALARAFSRYREDPWPWPVLMKRAVTMAQDIVEAENSTAPRLFESLAEPFLLHLLEEHRRRIAANIARHLGPATLVAAVELWEPHIPWEEPVLILRQQAYEAAGHPLAKRAAADLDAYRRYAPLPFRPDEEGR